jgi:predicted ABC-type ATPase
MKCEVLVAYAEFVLNRSDFYINEVDVVEDPKDPNAFQFVKGKSVIAILHTKSSQEKQALIEAYRREKTTLETIKQEKLKGYYHNLISPSIHLLSTHILTLCLNLTFVSRL